MSTSLHGVFHVLQRTSWFGVWRNAVVMELSFSKIMDSVIFTPTNMNFKQQFLILKGTGHSGKNAYWLSLQKIDEV